MRQHLPELPPAFVDPFTGYAPTNEVQMSGLLGLLHQMERVKWTKVPLLLPSNESSGKTADELFARTIMCGEYQLCRNSEKEMQLWGSMPADLICFSARDQRATVVENKIGSAFTGVQNDPVAGQLAKQVEFLVNCKAAKRALVLLSTRNLFNRGWYRNELLDTLRHADRGTRVKRFFDVLGRCFTGG